MRRDKWLDTFAELVYGMPVLLLRFIVEVILQSGREYGPDEFLYADLVKAII